MPVISTPGGKDSLGAGDTTFGRDKRKGHEIHQKTPEEKQGVRVF